MNPLNGFMGTPQNPVNNILQMMNGGMNPQIVVNQMLQRNPQARLFLQQMQNQANGRSPKEVVMQYARQNGISDQELMQLAERVGLK